MLGIDDIIGQGLSLINKFVPDANARAQASEEYKMAMLQVAAKADSDQTAINANEAQSSSLFVAGARPACMWLCVIGLGWQFFVAPLLTWASISFGLHVPPLPLIGDTTLTDLLYALLGLGGMRSIDKYNGVDTKSVGIMSSITGMFKSN